MTRPPMTFRLTDYLVYDENFDPVGIKANAPPLAFELFKKLMEVNDKVIIEEE